MWIPRGDIELDILAKWVNIRDGIYQSWLSNNGRDWLLPKEKDHILELMCD